MFNLPSVRPTNLVAGWDLWLLCLSLIYATWTSSSSAFPGGVRHLSLQMVGQIIFLCLYIYFIDRSRDLGLGLPPTPLPHLPQILVLVFSVVISILGTVVLLRQTSKACPQKWTTFFAMLAGWHVAILYLQLAAPESLYGKSFILICSSILLCQILSSFHYRISLLHFWQRDILGRTKMFPSLAKEKGVSKLSRGDAAPPIEVRSGTGNTISLESFKGKKLWLILYRYAGCPFCVLHLSEMEKRNELLGHEDLRVLSVFDSPNSDLSKLRKLNFKNVEFGLDAKKNIFRDYFSILDWSGLVCPEFLITFVKAHLRGIFQGAVTGHLARMPSHFLISETGVIQDAFYGSHPSDHIPWKRVETFLYARNN